MHYTGLKLVDHNLNLLKNSGNKEVHSKYREQIPNSAFYTKNGGASHVSHHFGIHQSSNQPVLQEVSHVVINS